MRAFVAIFAVCLWCAPAHAAADGDPVALITSIYQSYEADAPDLDGIYSKRLQALLDKDVAETQHGVRVVIDKMSVPYLSEATIDFVDSLEASGFTIDNPAAQGGCACGSSFH